MSHVSKTAGVYRIQDALSKVALAIIFKHRSGAIQLTSNCIEFGSVEEIRTIEVRRTNEFQPFTSNTVISTRAHLK